MKRVLGRRDRSGVSPVIGTILMVAVTVVLAAVLYVMVSGTGPATPPNPPAMQVQGSQWGGNATVANYTVTVVSAQNVAGINTTTLKFIATKADGTACYAATGGQNSTLCGNFTVNITYFDATVAGAITGSDTIHIRVTPASGNPLHMGRLTIQTMDDKILATVSL